MNSVDVDAFVRDGFVAIRHAFPRHIADACRALLWQEIGASPDDPSTWTHPVVRVPDITDRAFVEAPTLPSSTTRTTHFSAPGGAIAAGLTLAS